MNWNEFNLGNGLVLKVPATVEHDDLLWSGDLWPIFEAANKIWEEKKPVPAKPRRGRPPKKKRHSVEMKVVWPVMSSRH